jgi:hypothetical protein
MVLPKYLTVLLKSGRVGAVGEAHPPDGTYFPSGQLSLAKRLQSVLQFLDAGEPQG